MPEYRSRLEVALASGSGMGGGDADVEFMRHLETISEVTTFEQRCANSWAMSLQTRFVVAFCHFQLSENSGCAQRPQTITDTSPLQNVQTLSNLYAYTHQTGTKSTICSV
jgi:hypothetical protein